MKNLITAHNKKILKKDDTNKKMCNCRKKDDCLLDGKCLSDHIVYQATLKTEEPEPKTHTYIGITANTFKTRHANHKKSFKHEKYKTETELSMLVWDLKNQNINFDISWKIIDRASNFNPTTGKCNLCVLEKYYWIFKPELASINKVSDEKCPHKWPRLLKNR